MQKLCKSYAKAEEQYLRSWQRLAVRRHHAHLPIYLVTRLSAEELQSLRKYSPMNTFFEIYTVVTKEMILSDADTNDWVAIDFALGCTEDQRIFICIQGCYKKTEI